MNGAPHEHKVELHLGSLARPRVKYGDTEVRLYSTNPSERRVARVTRKAIRRHDKGSVRAEKFNARMDARVAARKAREDKALETAMGVKSDWWMDSEQRMNDLHDQALREGRYLTRYMERGGGGGGASGAKVKVPEPDWAADDMWWRRRADAFTRSLNGE